MNLEAGFGRVDTAVNVEGVWIDESWFNVGWKGGIDDGLDCNPGGLNLLIRF